mgnify:FL=1
MLAAIPNPLESTLAGPVPAVIVKLGIGRNLNKHAFGVHPLESAFTGPVSSVIVELSVRGNGNLFATISDSLIAALTGPILPGVVQFGVCGESALPGGVLGSRSRCGWCWLFRGRPRRR